MPWDPEPGSWRSQEPEPQHAVPDESLVVHHPIDDAWLGRSAICVECAKRRFCEDLGWLPAPDGNCGEFDMQAPH
jgi:hypothetical protein